MLVFASLLRHITSIVLTFSQTSEMNVYEILLNVIVEIMFSGMIPAALCYLCALIFHAISMRAGYMYCLRNDFIYLTMLFTAGARIIIGIVESFSFLTPVVLDYTSFFIEETVLTAALFAMYFGVLRPRFMNARTAYAVFNIYAGVYFFFQGLNTVVPCAVYLLMGSGTPVGEQFLSVLQTLTATPIEISVHVKAACIVGLCIFAAWLIATVVLSFVLRAAAKKAPQEPVVPDDGNDNNSGGGSPFAEFNDAPRQDKPSDKVFDEFDL